MELADEINESLGRDYATPDVDEEDLEAGTNCVRLWILC